MFETAEVGHTVDEDDYERRVDDVRVRLVNAQYDLRHEDGFVVLVRVVGDDLFGVDDVVRLLNEWMDARYLQTHVLRDPTDEEAQRPRMWRYWRRLPRRGEVGVFSGGVTREIVWPAGRGEIDGHERERRTDHVRRWERALTDDGALVIKFWLHLPRGELKRRIKDAKKDPERAWRVGPQTKALKRHLKASMDEAERFVRATDLPAAPWQLVEATDERYRNLAVAETLATALEQRIAGTRPPASPADAPVVTLATDPDRTVLDGVDLSLRLPKKQYKDRLGEAQRRLNGLTRTAADEGVTSAVVFEGWDAGGKGGCIRRLTRAVDAGGFRIVPVAAPTEEELAHHWLWRFWQHLPLAGRVLVFDRSWYGRVLVERVEGLTPEADWRRGYGEINDFEQQLCEADTVVTKFWLHIDRDEQLRRFEARQQRPYKHYKITDDDWRNRQRWDDYEVAVDEMVQRTSTYRAPWELVAANDKRHARVTVLETVADRLEAALG